MSDAGYDYEDDYYDDYDNHYDDYDNYYDDYDNHYDDDDDDDDDEDDDDAPSPRRRYGFFRCDDCGRHWESSHVYCDPETDKAKYAQKCKHCGTASFPYCVEPIRCSQCLETECVCTEDDLEEKKKRHVDPNKPHMKELCHKCLAGDPCT
nr:hypothetical protein BaRGS_029235 [Batillaria attramentaria]